jgi:peptide/nickel transport system permease protein
MVRAEVLRVGTLEFVLAARALGYSRLRILARHVLPNALTSTWASLPFGVASAAFAESALAFLGFGVAPPTSSWGGLLFQAYEYAVYPGAWWLSLFPGAALFVLLAACAQLGEGLQEALEPR